MKLRHLNIFLLLFPLSFALQAQADQTYFSRQYNTENGLSQNSIVQVMQDRHGMVWVATQAGLDKFIGNRILPIEEFQKQLNESITGLFDWNEKRILISTNTQSYLIHKWERDAKKISEVPYKNILYHLSISADTHLIVTNKKIYQVNGHFKASQSWSLPRHNRIHQVIQEKNHQLFLATDQGLYRFNRKEAFHPVYQSNKISSICFNADSTALYCGGPNSLFQLDLGTKTSKSLYFQQDLIGADSDYICALVLSKSGHKLWIATESNGIYVYDSSGSNPTIHFHPEQAFHSPAYLPSRYINCLYQTRDGVIWAGTTAGGLHVYPPQRKMFYGALGRASDRHPNLRKGNDVWSMLLDSTKGYLFAGLKDNGVAVIGLKDHRTQHWLYPAYGGKSVFVLKSRGDTLFLGTNAGLQYFHLNKLGRSDHKYTTHWVGKEAVLLRDTISILTYDEGHKIWLAGKRGGQVVHLFDQTFHNHQEIPLEQDHGALSFIELFNEKILLGTTQGVFQLTERYGKNVLSALLLNAQDKRHYTCALSNNSMLWLGTNKKGLYVYQQQGDKLVQTDSAPLAEVIYDLQLDSSHRIWLSTNHGLYQFRQETHDFNHYDTNNGLSVHEFNKGASVATSNGQLFFGGINGLDFFTPPKKALQSKRPYAAVLHAKYVTGGVPSIFDYNDNSSLNTLRLPYQLGSLEIIPMIGDYQDPFNNQFVLQLNGRQINPTLDGHYIIPERELSPNLWLWKKNRLLFKYRTSTATKLKSQTIQINRIFFTGVNFLWIPSILLVLVLWIGWRSNRKYRALQTRMNEISQLDDIDAMCTTALGHLVKDLPYAYAAISLVDFEEKRIQMQYIHDNRKSESEITEWKKLANYSLDHEDILAQVASSGENVILIGKVLVFGKLKSSENLFNDKIFKKFKHNRLSRAFIPIIHQETKEQKDTATVLGVIEVGYHFKWSLRSFNLFRDLTTRRLRLNIYADNFAQAYFKAYIKTQKQELYVNIEQWEKESSARGEDHQAFLQFALAKLSHQIQVEYGDISLTTFNSEKIDFQQDTLVYGHTLSQAERLAAHAKHQNKEGIINHVALTKTYYYSNLVQEDDKYIEFIPEVKSELAIPMLLRDNKYLAGVINFMSHRPNHFNQILAIKYQKGIHRLTELYLQKKQFFSLQKITTPVGAFSFTDEALYQSMVDALGEYFKSDYISVWMRQNPGSPSFILSSSTTIPAFYEEYAKLDFINANIGTEYQPQDEVVEVKTAAEIKEGSRIKKLFDALDFKAYIALKIVVDDQYQSFINVFSKRELAKEDVTGYSRFLLEEVSQRVALSSWNIRLTDSIEVISKSLTQRDTQNPLKKIVQQAYRLSPSADSVILYPYVQGRSIRHKDAIIAGNLPPEDNEDPERSLDFANYIIAHGTRWFETEAEYLELVRSLNLKSDHQREPFWKRRGLQSVAAIRLDFDLEPVGMMFFNYKSPKHFHGDEPRQFIEAFTNFATIALVNEEYIRKINEARQKISHELSLLSERQAELRKDTARLQRSRDEIQNKNNELERILDEILARASSESSFQILRGINHDIRNLLLEIQASMQKFKKHIPEKYHKPVNELIQDIKENTKHIGNILLLIKVGAQDVKKHIDVNKVLNQVIGLFKREDNNITFHSKYESDIPNLFYHETEFSMIFYNLLKNAAQATSSNLSGEITLTSSYRNNKYLITVEDNGEGIDNENLHKIFDLHYTTKDEGSGIGLYFVKEVVENKLQGRVLVESKKGKGTIFRVEIPDYVNFLS